MDILFKTEKTVFSYRVAGVLRCGDRWLVQKPPQDEDGYAFVGGHVVFGETNAQTLVREFEEELHQKITVGRLMGVGEIFIPWGARDCHQICLYYEVDFDGAPMIPTEGVFHGFDELGGERIDLDFYWLDRAALERVTVYPPEMVPHLLSGVPDVLHFVYREE